MTIRIDNKNARKLWLSTTGLSDTSTGPIDVMKFVKQLGFVQLDTIQNVTRAHHHIIWSRNQNYREHMIDELLSSKKHIFEHFTHDASVIPLEFYPMWKRQFQRIKDRIHKRNYFKSMLNEKDRNAIKKRISEEGPLSTHAFDTKVKGKKEMWERPPHKLALDYMWYSGELATSHREGFKKFYDLTSNVIPEPLRNKEHSSEEQVNWLCSEALHRLTLATVKDIHKFWDATDQKEVRDWVEQSNNNLLKVSWQTANGSWLDAYTTNDIEQKLEVLKKPSRRIKIMNPFDPAIRDRTRLFQLFGFDYKIEIFVPAAKRKWGYYVYPLLEGDRFVGRVELKADRKKAILNVINFWPEKGVKWSSPRYKRLETELSRFARLANLTEVSSNFPI